MDLHETVQLSYEYFKSKDLIDQVIYNTEHFPHGNVGRGESTILDILFSFRKTYEGESFWFEVHNKLKYNKLQVEYNKDTPQIVLQLLIELRNAEQQPQSYEYW